MNKCGSSIKISWWARSLAGVLAAATAVVACIVGHQWLQAGWPSLSLDDVVGCLFFGYVLVIFAWAAFTGKVPPFFPQGPRRWPFLPPDA